MKLLCHVKLKTQLVLNSRHKDLVTLHRTPSGTRVFLCRQNELSFGDWPFPSSLIFSFLCKVEAEHTASAVW